MGIRLSSAEWNSVRSGAVRLEKPGEPLGGQLSLFQDGRERFGRNGATGVNRGSSEDVFAGAPSFSKPSC